MIAPRAQLIADERSAELQRSAATEAAGAMPGLRESAAAAGGATW
ncbi:MAG: hypothetical protein JWP46_3184 [Modestobacter sp.]|jgi:hypothetical protein|nr:hypothetical protein [Modestobacter sp.]